MFDDLTQLASDIFDIPICLIALVDSRRLWFKSNVGSPLDEIERENSFCSFTILEEKCFLIENADIEPNFKNNPHVISNAKVKSYAGIPLIVDGDKAVGTFCVLDTKPRKFTDTELRQLRTIANQAQLILNNQYIQIIEREKTLRIDANLKAANEQLSHNAIIERTQEVARIGSWKVDIDKNLCTWSKMTYQIHEEEFDKVVLVEDGIKYYIPEHRPMISKLVEEAIQQHKSWDSHFQIITAKGKTRWVRTIGYPVFENDKLKYLEGTFQDVTEQFENQRELKLAKERAEKALKAKSIFLGNMSHEMRTPLNGIIGFADLMVQKDLPEDLNFEATQIRDSAKGLLNLIEDVLDITLLDSDNFKLKQERCSLPQIIRSCINVFKPTCSTKGIELNMTFLSEIDFLIQADPKRLRQVLLNIIGNSVKFTKKGSISVITQVISKDDNSSLIKISVSDTGRGIEASKIKDIFSPFELGDGSSTKAYQGTGIGLSISSTIVKKMGGDLSCASNYGKGTTFDINLPFTISPQNNSFEESINDNVVLDKNLNILIVEDNPINLILIKKILKNFGLTNLESANNGKEAIATFQKSVFDLVLMDVQMPIMNGLEATRFLRQELSSDVPIIGVSANAFKNDIDQAIALGMNDYITKPIDTKKLREIINKISKKVA